MNDLKEKILAMTKKDLDEIEGALKKNLTPYLDLVLEVAGHILFSGGKRLRPLLMVLSARICGYRGDYDKTLSVAFEYLHTATLLHDDIVDDASLRRGKPVAHSVYGAAVSVLVGDFLFSRASALAAGSESLDIMRTLAGIGENMSQGEIHQLIRKGQLDLSEEEYFKIIQYKTALLFKGACKTGAIIAGSTEGTTKAMSDYGFNLGTAFQMADDLIDYTSDTVDLGKEAGADLREGKLTLPVIASLKSADAPDRRRMEEIIGNTDFTVGEFNELVELMEKYGGLEYTKKLAAEYVTKAKDALMLFKPSETRDIMMDLADYTLARKA